MKKLLYVSILITGAILFSCNKEEIPAGIESNEVTAVAVDEVFQALTVDDIQLTVDQFSGFGEGFLKSGSIIGETTCPVVTVEKVTAGQEWPRKVTLDFGQGCTKNEKQL